MSTDNQYLLCFYVGNNIFGNLNASEQELDSPIDYGRNITEIHPKWYTETEKKQK